MHMDKQRFIQLRDLIGYGNEQMARMLRVSLEDVEAFCEGTQEMPEALAQELEDFADWSCELSHTETKRDLAKIYLNRNEND